MNDLGAALAMILLVGAIMLLVFLFDGDPDVWDLMLERTKETLQ